MTRLSKHLVCLTVVCLAILVSSSDARELRGRIFGVVSDSTGDVLPGVTVIANSPALIQPQVSVTGSGGSYRFPALFSNPTGNVVVSRFRAHAVESRMDEHAVGSNLSRRSDSYWNNIFPLYPQTTRSR